MYVKHFELVKAKCYHHSGQICHETKFSFTCCDAGPGSIIRSPGEGGEVVQVAVGKADGVASHGVWLRFIMGLSAWPFQNHPNFFSQSIINWCNSQLQHIVVTATD